MPQRRPRPARHPGPEGDVLIWHPALVHGSLAEASGKTRATITTYFCPLEMVPLGFEQGTATIRNHEGAAWYASGVYPDA